MSKPTPLSASDSTSRGPSTRKSMSTREHPEWRAELLTASLKIRSRSRRTSTPNLTLSLRARRVEAQRDVAQRENLVGVLAHPPRQVEQAVTLRVDRPDDVAHRADRLAGDARDGRERSILPDLRRSRAAAVASLAATVPSGHLTEQSDAREVGADVVVQVGRDARAHVGHLQQARDAIPVQRVDRSGPPPERSERQEPPRCQTGLRIVKVMVAGFGAHDSVGVHRADEESCTGRGQGSRYVTVRCSLSALQSASAPSSRYW